MMFLEQILQAKTREVMAKKAQIPVAQLTKELAVSPAPRPFGPRLSGEGIKLIAEVKRASPSKGMLCPALQPGNLARIYEEAGAAALSVLTEEKYFLGSLHDLTVAKNETGHLPVLRKDFIIDPYQILEARVYGADAVLLIAAILPRPKLTRLIQEAKALGMDALVEIHNQAELADALAAGAEIIGINNRDLKTFQVDPETTFRLVDAIPKEKVIVAESGIKDRRQLQRLAAAGVQAALVGEALVTAADPGAKLRELRGIAHGSG